MKTLMAPWRMEHVLGNAEKVSGCLFEPPGKNLSTESYFFFIEIMKVWFSSIVFHTPTAIS